MAFHLFVFASRKYLEVIHAAQFVAIFYLQTVDEVTHESFSWLIWLLHPGEVISAVKTRLNKKPDPEGEPKQCPIQTYILFKALTFSAGVNQIPIHAQATEAAIRDFFHDLDCKKLLERVTSASKTIFPFFEKFEDAETEIIELPEPEAVHWFHIRFWERTPKKVRSVLFAHLKKEQNDDGASVHTNPLGQSLPVSRSDQIEELDDAETSMATDGTAPNSASSHPVESLSKAPEPLATPSFLELKNLWGDRIRKRRSH